MKVAAKCYRCGNTFYRKASELGRYNHNYCSYNCASGSKGSTGQAICNTCGKSFTRKPSELARYKYHYCSIDCAQKAQLALAGMSTCDQCGKRYRQKPSQARRYKSHYCSRLCLKLAHRITVPCSICLKPITRAASCFQGLRHVCSRLCNNMLRSRDTKERWRATPWRTGGGRKAGFHHLPETIAKMRGPRHRRKATMNTRRKMSDSWFKARRPQPVYPYSRNRLETIFMEAMTKAGISFIPNDQSRYGWPDLSVGRICIFIDGDHWHANPSKYDAGYVFITRLRGHAYRRTAMDVWEKDKRVTSRLESDGYIVLRFWESEIKANLQACIQKVISLKQLVENNYVRACSGQTQLH